MGFRHSGAKDGCMEKISTGAVEMNEMSVTTLIIRQRGDRLFTTSLDVAEKFGKRHDHVLR